MARDNRAAALRSIGATHEVELAGRFDAAAPLAGCHSVERPLDRVVKQADGTNAVRERRAQYGHTRASDARTASEGAASL